ncbi:ABC transporter ATP-binding protein [Haloplanus sp. GCM10025708]|uniref:ABC transporter ATP-binding protein n=1 Tax=Haloferacaceae TaxID=1644056 RepID=UPI003611F05A
MTSREQPTSETDERLILETDGLTKRFGGLTAVDDVDFELPEGELRCLIGPNGAGKSTFLKLVTGAHSPTSGTVRFDGEDITGLEPHDRVRRGMSLKFQQISTYQALTVEQNLRVPTQRIRSGQEATDRVEELLDIIGLSDRRTERAGSLAHGDQQWLEIAMAMATDPKLLLLDEPTAGMTVEETQETGELIQDLVDEGVTILVVEHDINLVRQIADRVTVLHQGRIFTEGTVEEITADEDVKRIYLGKAAEGSA